MNYRKKLIEVALLLDAINRESAREKSIRHGHPSTLHLWWSRKPLATSRAVVFASLIDDPSARPEEYPTLVEQDQERVRLFRFIGRLVEWENSDNEGILKEAQAYIKKSTSGLLPLVVDPFCGGGSIPLEASRLGLRTLASDLNPVAVIITKALIEYPSLYLGQHPINPDASSTMFGTAAWKGARGLASDVRYYGKWLYSEAHKRIGHLYPKVRVPEQLSNREGTVISWLYCRTVRCPNPVCGSRMPLISKYWLANKGNKKVWAEPIVDITNRRVSFVIRSGAEGPPPGTVNRQGGKCLFCNAPVPLSYIRAEGQAGRLGDQLLAVVVKGTRGRTYLPPETVVVPQIPESQFLKEIEAAQISGYFNPPIYGYRSIGSMFNSRQRYALSVFSSLVQEARACASGMAQMKNTLAQ